MVVPSYKDYLDIPGGYIEHGETPTQAAAREVKEELGIIPPIGGSWSWTGHRTPPRATSSCSCSTGE
ncbi:NUDIX domain-containing protein [Nocardiopsis protaetiae]